jgi:hypothetical protein
MYHHNSQDVEDSTDCMGIQQSKALDLDYSNKKGINLPQHNTFNTH